MKNGLHKTTEAGSDWQPGVLALHTVTDEVDGEIITGSGGPLDVHAYSMFKYGDGDIAARAGAPYEIGREDDGLVQPMTLMTMGPYQEPRGAFLPSVLH